MTDLLTDPPIQLITTRQVGWTIGPCTHCGGREVLRVEDVVKEGYIWLFRVREETIGKNHRCDLCERPVAPPDAPEIHMAYWQHEKGIPSLAARLGVPPPDGGSSEPRMRSVLSATRDASAPMSVDVTPGAIAGMAAGLLLGIPISVAGVMLKWFKWFGARTEAPLFVIVAMGVSIFLGAIVGAAIQGMRTSRKKTDQMLRNAVRHHHLDLAQLAVLGREYGSHVEEMLHSLQHSA